MALVQELAVEVTDPSAATQISLVAQAQLFGSTLFLNKPSLSYKIIFSSALYKFPLWLEVNGILAIQFVIKMFGD